MLLLLQTIAVNTAKLRVENAKQLKTTRFSQDASLPCANSTSTQAIVLLACYSRQASSSTQ